MDKFFKFIAVVALIMCAVLYVRDENISARVRDNDNSVRGLRYVVYECDRDCESRNRYITEYLNDTIIPFVNDMNYRLGEVESQMELEDTSTEAVGAMLGTALFFSMV